jgi:hypothetical protein
MTLSFDPGRVRPDLAVRLGMHVDDAFSRKQPVADEMADGQDSTRLAPSFRDRRSMNRRDGYPGLAGPPCSLDRCQCGPFCVATDARFR